MSSLIKVCVGTHAQIHCSSCLNHFSVEKQVKEIIHRAFWDAFHEKITEDPPDYSQAVILIQEVKEVLLRPLEALGTFNYDLNNNSL